METIILIAFIICVMCYDHTSLHTSQLHGARIVCVSRSKDATYYPLSFSMISEKSALLLPGFVLMSAGVWVSFIASLVKEWRPKPLPARLS